MGHLLFDATLLGTGSSKTSLYMALGVDIWLEGGTLENTS